MFKQLFILILILIQEPGIYAQCCSGGSGSPIAGGSSQGVLTEKQIEINSSFQYVKTNVFFRDDARDTAVYFDSYSTQYNYSRLAYGISKNFTFSLETGYYFNKTQIGLSNSDTITSSGISDLVLFPKYDILNSSNANSKTEITIGLGYKIPLGSYNDSTGITIPITNKVIYQTKPLGVQVSSGSQDIIFYTFLFRGYPSSNFRIFTNAVYIKKGWNPLGEKIGDYAAIGIFAGKTFFEQLGITLQVKGEWNDQMKLNKNIRLYAYPNYDPDATGSKKIFISPQVSYTIRCKLIFYALYDLPVYQFLTKTQAGSQYQITAGISYRFLASKIKS